MFTVPYLLVEGEGVCRHFLLYLTSGVGGCRHFYCTLGGGGV